LVLEETMTSGCPEIFLRKRDCSSSIERGGPMNSDDIEIRHGMRVRLSVLGKERCPRLKNGSGVILRRNGPSTIRVLFDGRKQPITLHESYVEIPELALR
jgi:hypothetical protein